MDFSKFLPNALEPRNDQATQGAIGALMGVALGAIMTDLFLEKGKETAQQAAQPQGQNQPVNPYRGSQTVGDVEKALLQQPSSHRREYALKELAKYPETMPLAQLPTQTMHLLAGN